ncbi:MAG: MTAP family purine nucleoside phosphorylase [Deltaproteobacteria bacterium]
MKLLRLSPKITARVKVAVIARVAAHRPFVARGLQSLGTEVYQTPYGDSRPVHFFAHAGLTFAVLSRHGETGYEISAPFLNPRANLFALKALGVEKILAWVAPGSLNTDMAPGDLVVPHDVLDEGKGRPQTFYSGVGWGFIRHNPVFCPELRAKLLAALAGERFTVHDRAVYIATTGPRLETAAEIRKFRLSGGDLVGQTLVPEIFPQLPLPAAHGTLPIEGGHPRG